MTAIDVTPKTTVVKFAPKPIVFGCNGIKVGPNPMECDETNPKEFIKGSTTRCKKCHALYVKYAYHAKKAGVDISKIELFGEPYETKVVLKTEPKDSDEDDTKEIVDNKSKFTMLKKPTKDDGNNTDDEFELAVEKVSKDEKIAKLRKRNKALKMENSNLKDENEQLEEEIANLYERMEKILRITENAVCRVEPIFD
ncbi:hypothetical protein BGX28_005534 [Mortierella sp. GBA30]|nr:hypothetical protein BGX28_005534 [Mortierella sp. GBA30]